MWARATQDAGMHGLPMLSKCDAWGLDGVTTKGVAALALAFITNCPRVTLLNFAGRKKKVEADEAMVVGMVDATGCRYRLDFKV